MYIFVRPLLDKPFPFKRELRVKEEDYENRLVQELKNKKCLIYCRYTFYFKLAEPHTRVNLKIITIFTAYPISRWVLMRIVLRLKIIFTLACPAVTDTDILILILTDFFIFCD